MSISTLWISVKQQWLQLLRRPLNFPPARQGRSSLPQLLAAMAATNPLLQTGVPPMNNFGMLPQPTPTTLRAFQNATAAPPAPFMSARSAFHPVHRPSVVEFGPSPPRPSATLESQPASVIQLTPIINGRDPSRPSVVQQPLDFSKLTAASAAIGHHVHFIDQLPLAQEPRQSGLNTTSLTLGRTEDLTAMPHPQPQAPIMPLQPPATSQSSILGSLLSAQRLSPTVPQSRTEKQSGLTDDKSSEDLKTSMSNLAVQLNSNSLCQSSSSTGPKSDTDSLPSPQSTRSGSHDHTRSQNSPVEGECASGGDSKDTGSTKRSTPDMERYRDRRRRNNEAAKRCRANRRAAFEYRSKRSQQLELENSELRQELLRLSNELEQLKAIIAARNGLLPTP